MLGVWMPPVMAQLMMTLATGISPLFVLDAGNVHRRGVGRQ